MPRTQERTTAIMLSDLVRYAQAVLAEHGDMPVCAQVCYASADDTEQMGGPVVDPPVADTPRHCTGAEYWGDLQVPLVFIVGGQG